MATVHQTPDGKMAYSKGAPEIILEACNRIYLDGNEKAITREDREKVLGVAQSMASDALRILGIAVKHMPESGDKDESPEAMPHLLYRFRHCIYLNQWASPLEPHWGDPSPQTP